jgi:hypothetical protein
MNSAALVGLMLKNCLTLLGILILIALTIFGQRRAEETSHSLGQDTIPTVTLDELLRHSSKYKNKIVRVRALYESWFEGSQLKPLNPDSEEGPVWAHFPESVRSRSKPGVAERLEDIFFKLLADEKENPIGKYDVWQTELLVTGKIYKSEKREFGIHGGYTYLFEVASVEEIGTIYRYDLQTRKKIPYISESSEERSKRHALRAQRVCKSNSEALDKMLTRMQSPDEKITLVAMLGSNEKSRQLNRERLDAIRNYLIRCAGIDRKRIIVKEGERTRFEGRVNVFRGNQLSIILLAATDKNICLEDCNN